MEIKFRTDLTIRWYMGSSKYRPAELKEIETTLCDLIKI